MNELAVQKILDVWPTKSKKWAQLYGWNPGRAPGGMVADPAFGYAEAVSYLLWRQ